MPVDKDALRQTLREALGDDALVALFEEKLAANDTAATQFLAGFMRNRDYTQKSQGLADDRRALEGQVEQYRGLLDAAEAEKAKTMKLLANRDITIAQAHAILKNLKQNYQLSDDEVPSFQDVVDTARKGKPVDSSNEVDVDSKLAAFEQRMQKYITDKLIPELGGMAQLDIAWNDIREEHKELTGKRLTMKEENELLAEADKRGRAGRPISLKGLWEEKYDGASMRQKRHDEELIKGERAKWDAEEQAKRSEAALQGIHPSAPDQTGLRTSQILNHKFQVHDELPAGAPKPREVRSSNERQALSGAERAAKRHIERRTSGVPMGAPDERKATTKVA